jgi:RNA polymerase sigma-70 factor (ECF subfamily)
MSAAGMTPLHSKASNHSLHDLQVSEEERLLASAKVGHTEAFDELCKRHAEQIFHVVHRITRNREDSEDAMQESFLRAFIHLEDFDGRSRFQTWLTRIAMNSALMKLRKNRTLREIQMEESIESSEPWHQQVPDPALNPEERCAKHERESILREAIAKLRPRIRDAVEIYQLQECSLDETADSLGISVAAVKGRLFHARAALRRVPRLKFALRRTSSIRRTLLREMQSLRTPLRWKGEGRAGRRI